MNIARINEEEERLDIQRKIHHKIGQCIILAEHYLNEEDGDNIPEEIISMWDRVFHGNTDSEEKGNMEEKEKEIIEAALISGCQVQFIGQRKVPMNKLKKYKSLLKKAKLAKTVKVKK